jgi:hypothetical protein
MGPRMLMVLAIGHRRRGSRTVKLSYLIKKTC